MTSYKRFETCEKCGGPIAARQAHPFPIVLQVLFGLSFVALIFGWDRLHLKPWMMWTWSGIMAVLGFLLLRARQRAAKKVLICIRCGTPVASA